VIIKDKEKVLINRKDPPFEFIRLKNNLVLTDFPMYCTYIAF